MRRSLLQWCAAMAATAFAAIILAAPDDAQAAGPQTAASPVAAPQAPEDAPDRRVSGILPANLVAKSGSIKEALQKFQGMRTTPRRADARSAATGGRAADEGRTTAGQAARASFVPPSAPDPAFVTECAGREGAGEAGGYVRNRFEWCQHGYSFDIHYDTRGVQTGFVIMYYEMIGYGRDDGTRNVTVWVRPRTITFDGERVYTPTATMGLEVECTGEYDEMRGCSDGPEHRFTMTEWAARAAAGQWVAWEIDSDEGSATDPFDAVLYHAFNLHVSAFDRVERVGAKVPIRCDSAPYFNNRPKACIFFDVIPHLQYALTDSSGRDTKYRAVAEHIRHAQKNPNDTDPLKSGDDKKIPGEYTGGWNNRFLTRVPGPDSTYPTNEFYLRNKGYQQSACASIRTPTDMENPECDEYPFASTFQGAANPDWDFSVKYVPGEANSSAGGVLGNYYNADRILYFEDEFYVEIVDRAGATAPEPPVLRTVPEAQGNEGAPIKLYATSSTAGEVKWNYAPRGAYDEGTHCTFANPDTLTPTFTCNDDGIFDVIVTLQSPGQELVSARVVVTVLNVAPTVSFKTPVPWNLFRVNSTVVFEAPIVDPGANDDQRCQFTWDDGTTYTSYPPTRTCTAVKSYDHAGMYTVDLQVTDDDSGTGRASVMIVVYDPGAGTANIDGSTTTPAGALVAQPTATSPSRVTYHGAYSPGAYSPYGRNKTWMDGNSFAIESTSMQWLVITPDGKVAALGTGTVGGRAGYTWVTYGWDACPGNGGCQRIPADRIRMAVIDTNGTTVYDNAPSSGEWDVDRISPRDMTSGAVQIHR
jgi:hypothetical protein